MLVGVLGLAVALLGVGGETAVGTRLAGDTSAALSNVGRTLVRQDSFAVVRRHGITGIGLQWLFQPHNLVLGVLAATGVIGFAGLLIVVVTMARRLVTTSTTDPVTLAVISAALAVYTCAWVVNVGWDRWFWIPVALVFTARPSAGGSGGGRDDVSRARRPSPVPAS